MMGQVDGSALNLAYNLADFVDKIALCLAIRASAKVNEQADDEKTEEREKPR